MIGGGVSLLELDTGTVTRMMTHMTTPAAAKAAPAARPPVLLLPR